MKTSKKQTKKDREIEVLIMRLRDIAVGAGVAAVNQDSAESFHMSAKDWWRYLGGIREALVSSDRGSDEYMIATAPWNLDEYQTLLSAAEFLHKIGVRG